jgi:UrcA family protein
LAHFPPHIADCSIKIVQIQPKSIKKGQLFHECRVTNRPQGLDENRAPWPPGLSPEEASSILRNDKKNDEKGEVMKMILAAALAIGSSGAIAQPVSPAEPSEQVRYSDLNLLSAPGKAALQRRIRAAAGRVCDFGGTMKVEEFSASGRCYRTAVKDGLRQMDQVIASNLSGSALAASALVVSGQ